MSTTLEGISHEIKELPNCRRALHIKVAPEIVENSRNGVASQYTSMARIPGYRPGKAPKAMVLKRFKKQIDEELQRKVVSDTVEDVIKSENLRVMVFGDVEDIEELPDGSMSYKVVVVVRPEFELPEYKGLPIKQLPAEVADEQITSALDRVRERMAEFKELPEGTVLAKGTYAVLQYKGTIEGEPISEKLGEQRLKYWDTNEQFWLEMGSRYEDDFFPGLTEKLEGLTKGDSRDVVVDFPEDFQEEALRGQSAEFHMTVKEMTQRILPEVNDELAAKMLGEGKTVEDLKSQISNDLLENVKNRNQRLARTQVARGLSSQVQMELPEHQVANETRRIADNMVQENLRNGISEEILEENQGALVAAASQLAENNVKERYLLVRIADKEGLAISHDEIVEYINAIAPQYRMTGEQLHKQVHKSGAEARIEEDLLIGKALQLLVDNAVVTIDPNAEQEETDLQNAMYGDDEGEEHEHVHGPDCDHDHDHDHGHAHDHGAEAESDASPKA